MKYWLLKSEPGTFGIEHLLAARRRRTRWDGVRNYQVRNMLRDEMRVGDLAFFYHSSCAVPGIYGIVKIVAAGRPDPTAFDRRDAHYDPKSDPAAPTWYSVEIELVKRLAEPITLEKMQASARALGELLILRRGNRLSITPVTAAQWRKVLALA